MFNQFGIKKKIRKVNWPPIPPKYNEYDEVRELKRIEKKKGWRHNEDLDRLHRLIWRRLNGAFSKRSAWERVRPGVYKVEYTTAQDEVFSGEYQFNDRFPQGPSPRITAFHDFMSWIVPKVTNSK
jgi:hypothetical protein